MENLISYLKEQKIYFKQVGENVFIINDNSYELIKPDEDGRLFTEDFVLIADNTNCDNYIFSFGGKWYSILNGLEDKPKLNEIKYIGKSDEEFETKCFLGVRGEFEILNGTSNYRDWCRKSKFLGVEYLGICEKNTLAGIIKFQENCKKFNIKPIIGATYTVQKSDDLKYDLKFYVKNEVGWNNLLQINKEVNCVNNSRLIGESVLKNFIDGLFIVVDPKSIEYNSVPLWIKKDCYYQLDTVEFESEEKDTWYLNNLKLFKNSNLKPVSITDAYYLDKEYAYIKLLLNEVSGVRDYKSNNQYFKSKGDYFRELSLLFNQDDDGFYDIYQEAINNELYIAKTCSEFNIQTGSRHLPIYERIGDELKFDSNEDLFWSLIEQGLSKLDQDKDINLYINRVNKEFDVIEKGGVIDYFLMLHDIVSWCKNNDILVGIGRGSAGGSLISMMLGLIHLDPIEFDLLFERFLNEGRIKKSLPDIDTDIESLRRNEVKQYIENRFGISQVISIGTYTCLQLKAAIKDLCRVYNVSFEESNYITSLFDEHQNSIDELFKLAARNETIKKFLNSYPELINTLSIVLGSPKAKSVHACAMVIFPKEKDMYSWAPIMKQGDLLVSEWEGGEMEKVGFLKEDILGIKQLDKFRNIINLIEKNTAKKIDIYSIPFDDKNVYKFFKKGYNGDCFHFGSKGLTGYCKELKPENIDDLIAGISLYRPGAMENNFHNEYVLRKSGEHEVEYSVGTESILNTTYGVFVYQEQIMKLCQVLGGLSLVEADDVRKAMVKKTYEELTKYRERFIPYYVENFKVSLDYATNVWDQIDKASTYLFNRCISGDEKIQSLGVPYKYTIGEMWRLRNDKGFAKSIGVGFYYKNEYGFSYSLHEDNKLRKNKIKDIRFIGIKPIYRMTLINGATIDTTINHKFPTSNGEKKLEDINIDKDKIYYNIGYVQEIYKEVLLGDGKLNSEKGTEGFTKKEELSTENLKLNYYRINMMKDFCEVCNNNHRRLEIHHKDFNHGNNEFNNLITLCPSCHKKEHYKNGRVKIGEKGLYTELLSISSIEFLKNDEVFDVEMEDPYHTFVTQNGVVTSNSHAAAYAITGYISQWFKVNYPIYYWSTAFTFLSQEDIKNGKISLFISEINKTGDIKVSQPDVNNSESETTSNFELNTIYWGLVSIKQCGEIAVGQIIEERYNNGKYFSLDEFLERHTFKGSKVNKSVVENLILSGAFDEIEEVKYPSERMRLINYYREKNKVKPDKEKDLFIVNKDSIKEDYWWSLQQKRMSGLSFFDYQDLCDKYIGGRYIDQQEYQSESLHYTTQYSTGGYISEVIERTSKKGKYCSLYIESNYFFLWTTIFPEQYKLFIDNGINLVEEKSSIILLSGNIVKDTYKKENVMRLNSESQFLILK